jgi:hypothetical protein
MANFPITSAMIKNVVKLHRRVASSTIFLGGLNDVVYSLETSHFKFKATIDKHVLAESQGHKVCPRILKLGM